MENASPIDDPRVVEAVRRVESAAYQSDTGGPLVQSHLKTGRDDSGNRFVIVEVVCKFRFPMVTQVSSI
jgi:hypothetical protein